MLRTRQTIRRLWRRRPPARDRASGLSCGVPFPRSHREARTNGNRHRYSVVARDGRRARQLSVI